jgi:hypothetical protein
LRILVGAAWAALPRGDIAVAAAPAISAAEKLRLLIIMFFSMFS